MGLLIMAESGYDPSAALDLWARWEQVEEDDSRVAYFLRTHPSHHARLQLMNTWLTEAGSQRPLGDRGGE